MVEDIEMRTRFLRGNTTENNGLTLEPGELTVDLEAKAVRLHDGTTLGGFEMVGTQAVDLGPGPQTLIAGDQTTGFYGEVTEADFFTKAEIATLTGFSVGSEETLVRDWLKFQYEGKILYYPKGNVRSGDTLTWNSLYNTGLVYGVDSDGLFPTTTPTNQNVIISSGSHQFRVRLMRGADADPTAGVLGREWTDLMVPLVDGTWATYTQEELGRNDVTAGYLIMMESNDTGSAYWYSSRHAFTDGGLRGKQYTTFTKCWRPVLELIE